jgi:hypothetical protein
MLPHLKKIIVVAQRFCSRVGMLCFPTLVVCSSQTQQRKNVCKYVRPPELITFQTGGLTNFAHKLIARNHQQKTLVVARIIAFAHRKFPARWDSHFIVRAATSFLPHTLAATAFRKE